jgi:hypothetical protein
MSPSHSSFLFDGSIVISLCLVCYHQLAHHYTFFFGYLTIPSPSFIGFIVISSLIQNCFLPLHCVLLFIGVPLHFV